ncbi:MAG: class I SAM-dependent methyltransferase [Chitinophagaceae bacterium]
MSTKAIQGQLWSIAPTYWSQHFEPWFLPMYRKVLEHLNLSSEYMVLDAGCGSGLFSNLAIKTGAQVMGIDAAPGMLEVARMRNPKNNFLEEDLEAMPFADNSFDVIVGFNSFQYAGSFENALKEAKRVLKPGGRLVLAIWDKPELSDATSVLKSIGTLLPPPPPGTPGPFALSEDGKMEEMLEKVELELTYRTWVNCPFLYASMRDGVKSFMGTGPAAAAMNNNSKEVVEKAITKALKPFAVTDGFHFLQNRFLIFITEKW